MKKLLSLALLAITIVSLTACSSTSDSDKTDKGTQKVENKTKKQSKWTFDGTTFTTKQGIYTITAVKKMPSAEDGKNVIVFEFDFKNNTKKEIDMMADNNWYVYVHATQKTKNSNKSLDPGTIGLDANANSLEQAREDVMTSDSVLPGKTVQGVASYTLVNDAPVKLKFSDEGFNTIATKEYTVK
ncbi:hypothetical protein RD055328_08780 [Companilactobacillus sp. RD055328]|uniref:DUF5067 domain-containing protein n=1 Tax=Companilactobacillus sp. RD055328 TaxID=2916634 RepID=UPI001FC812F0|nr:DUF5067 domain-containing protein [Companilactobacillus sp. RD055328]GKQ42955.1 hypothetical protein RD055328_08780 [Companilactobacillus sp. RD055328]